MGTYSNTTIAFGDLKEALLHFEYIIPLNFTGACMGLRPKIGESTPVIESFKKPSPDSIREMQEGFGNPVDPMKLVPPHLANNQNFKDSMRGFDGLLLGYMVKISQGQETFEKYVRELIKVVQKDHGIHSTETSPSFDPNILCPSIEVLQRMFHSMVREYKLENVTVDCSQLFRETQSDSRFENCLSATQIRIIDTTKVSFAQIMEFRKDKEVMNKMRNFRLFAYEQYNGKDKAFIEDDIQKRLDDYYDAVKASGFDTTIKTFSFLFESKLLFGTLATSVASLLMGNTHLAEEAFSAGAIIELGKLSLEYAKNKNEVRKICKENPISFVVDAKKKLEKHSP